MDDFLKGLVALLRKHGEVTLDDEHYEMRFVCVINDIGFDIRFVNRYNHGRKFYISLLSKGYEFSDNVGKLFRSDIYKSAMPIKLGENIHCFNEEIQKYLIYNVNFLEILSEN